MTVSTLSVALVGLQGHIIEVETHVGRGLVAFTLVGLPDASLRESKERVRAALQTCGLEVLDRHIIVNLSPAGLPKSGSGFDLAIAVSVLIATKKIRPEPFAHAVLVAEIALDGTLRPVPGVLPALIAAQRKGVVRAIVAPENVQEAELVPGIEVISHGHLSDVVMWAGGRADKPPQNTRRNFMADSSDLAHATSTYAGDISDIRGQNYAIEALEVAAAGGHHLHCVGEPGSGKTMLIQRMPTILPALDDEIAMTTTAIHSLAGVLLSKQGLIRQPPLQSPHHSVTMPALIGGGSPVLRPGAVSLAHGGVLFLDEAPEFSPRVLDALRQPLEEGEVSIHRARGHTRFPADFQLVLASNPCPCGGGNRVKKCTCSSIQRRRYQARLSGPLLDRIDITVGMRAPTRADLLAPSIYTSAQIKDRVSEARARAAYRLRDTQWHMNRQVTGSWLRQCSQIPVSIVKALDEAVDRSDITMRGADRILRVMWTAADLEGATRPDDSHLGFALSLRTGGAYV
ncbi:MULTISPECIES: YifB family Mg chelatase-like AAA ATPase [unclassified Schaalia]|uniref:YifB family Mg chelatase-like AAA ATPase n=1 Tax=unclassified Schaalia TaxID=2691889 RepID=UPI001E45C35B|nr:MULTISPECIES: YifB family Mg chelatase-like AAA ATPase [unclassified Schaalia]MCD4549314.1 YifB family Mg chelatase-like AAA ATPase [Schaalia sp. lx-260]MCD4557123.1 YifB family Mg chelatase-like AAA ATPase [Schaalia sp. lx-100]